MGATSKQSRRTRKGKAFRKSKVMIGLFVLMALMVTAACAPAAGPAR